MVRAGDETGHVVELGAATHEARGRTRESNPGLLGVLVLAACGGGGSPDQVVLHLSQLADDAAGRPGQQRLLRPAKRPQAAYAPGSAAAFQ